MKFKALINLLPIVAIGAILATIGYQFWQTTQATRPDYDTPSEGSAELLDGDNQPNRPRQSPEQPAGVVTEAKQIQVPQTEVWQLVRVTDGDTIVVRQGSREEKIRFCGIDAPEQEQPLGQESKAYLEQLLSSQNVGIVPVERDRYGRMVAEVFVLGTEEKFVQQEMLTSGMAYVYPQYVDGCWNGQQMKMAEAIAQKAHRGVWAGNHQKPWDYRHAQ